jgi:hypothetical protein
MIKIKHQLLYTDYFIPSWEIKHLFLGTFNPEGGFPVPYFYGRAKNFTWKLLNDLFPGEFRSNDRTLRADFFDQLRANHIACMDMIRSVIISEENTALVIGKGYRDSMIINKKVIREYNTNEINKVIMANQDIRVYSTWGKGSSLREWNQELSLIAKPVIKLRSPSPAARVPKGVEKYNHAFLDWSLKIR